MPSSLVLVLIAAVVQEGPSPIPPPGDDPLTCREVYWMVNHPEEGDAANIARRLAALTQKYAPADSFKAGSELISTCSERHPGRDDASVAWLLASRSGQH
jgi:hypothetical protein